MSPSGWLKAPGVNVRDIGQPEICKRVMIMSKYLVSTAFVLICIVDVAAVTLGLALFITGA
jgi:hypothetical protein